EKHLFYPLKKYEKEFTKESLKELDDLVSKNSSYLEVENFIYLFSKLEINKSSSLIEEVVHSNKNFDITDLISN
ncbi:3333_t:CDS:1, partial [Cetraspora pellucida]